MFTGLIQTLGEVAEIQRSPSGARLVIALGSWGYNPAPGESIAVNGCCLTVAAWDNGARLASFDVVEQTLRMTALGGLRAHDRVNLEHALRADSLLGGHFVQGHVDGVGRVLRVQANEADWRVRVAIPDGLAAYMVARGSVALDGVSLTIAQTSGAESAEPWIEVALIPVTRAHTTLGGWSVGSACNIEADMLVKAVVTTIGRMLPPRNGA